MPVLTEKQGSGFPISLSLALQLLVCPNTPSLYMTAGDLNSGPQTQHEDLYSTVAALGWLRATGGLGPPYTASVLCLLEALMKVANTLFLTLINLSPCRHLFICEMGC